MSTTTIAAEQKRAAYLLDAQTKAVKRFEEIERDLIRPGISEKTLSDEIHELGTKRHNIRTHWHKRVVRSGPNTLMPYTETPSDRIIQEDDILFVNLGPVFEAWEADFGRTFVLGNDPTKKKLRDSLELIWLSVKKQCHEDPSMTGGGLYNIACGTAKKEGWEFGARLLGILLVLSRMSEFRVTRSLFTSLRGATGPLAHSGLMEQSDIGFRRSILWIVFARLGPFMSSS